MSNVQQLPTLRYRNRFRKYQLEAISMARRYIRDYRSKFSAGADPSGRDFSAALVYHPTGTGKTAIIAGIAHAAAEIGNVLVLTTRESIRDQLACELSGNLFIHQEKFDLGCRIRLTKPTYVLTESQMLDGTVEALHESTRRLFTENVRDFATKQFERLVDHPAEPFVAELQHNRSIVIMTVQMLVGLKRKKDNAYQLLKDYMDVVLFDEGHYEPAVKYCAAARGLGKPLVLMSATPFRNDLKPFNIKADHIHIYKFAQAVAERVIRDVSVEHRPAVHDCDAFCRDVIDFCKGKFGQNHRNWPRIIVHCDNMVSIENLGDAFISHGFKDQVIGIHDNFHRSRLGHQPWQHHTVPLPRETEALIWIHQYKLMEGIDDYRFGVLAFFNLLKNVRSVVQQIGRVIRKGGNERDKDAIVLDHYCGRILQYWNLYRGYDRSITKEYLTKTLSRYFLDEFTEILPEIDYINQKFRVRLNLKAIPALDDEILFDRRVTNRHPKT